MRGGALSPHCGTQEIRTICEVTEARLSRQMFRWVQIYRHNSFYRFLMSICELAFTSTIPKESGEGYSFSDPLRDDAKNGIGVPGFCSCVCED
jgi:hypothetical protein